MAMMPAMPASEEMPMEEAPADAGGYCVELSVLADGTFKVSGPRPLKEEDDGYEGKADFTNIGEALKDMLRIIKENPVGGGDQANFEAGYAR